LAPAKAALADIMQKAVPMAKAEGKEAAPKRIVLVLGAGASMPYRFPDGKRLRTSILKNLAGEVNQPFGQLKDCGFAKDLLIACREDLYDAAFETIDDFLDARPSYRELGGYLIAQALMVHENERVFRDKRDWYPFLFDALGFRNEAPTPIIGIVTFNYDRSVEHYLWKTLNASHEGERKERIEERLKRLPIIHLHGILGAYEERPYGPAKTPDDLCAAAHSVRITSDDGLAGSEEYAQARDLLSSADRVAFLGIGYHRASLERLDLLAPNAKRHLLGTAFKMEDSDRLRVQTMFGKQITLYQSRKTIVHTFRQAVSTRPLVQA